MVGIFGQGIGSSVEAGDKRTYSSKTEHVAVVAWV